MNNIEISKLKALLCIDENEDVNDVNDSLKKNKEVGQQQRDYYTSICIKEFSSKVWNALDNISREHILTAHTGCAYLYKLGFDISGMIQRLSSALEDELKAKIFDEFNEKYIKNNLNRYNDKVDKDYIRYYSSETQFIPTSTLLKKLEYVGDYFPRGLCRDLQIFLDDDWYLDLLSNSNSIDKARELAEVRNNNSHNTIEEDIKKFIETREKTIKVLKWFIGSMVDYHNN